MKLLTIIGARPQFIKAAAVSRAVANHSARNAARPVEEIIVHTGQHYDANMSDIFFEEMSIPRPDHQMDIHGMGHGAMTGQMLEQIEKVILDETPDTVLVYGDTNTTLAGALAASKLHVPVAHVEAGLRSFNRRMPEEINRVVADHVSDVLFCPTDTAVNNLAAEGITDGRSASVVRCGDVMLDAALFYAQKARDRATVFSLPAMAGIKERGFALCTVHRAENTDDPQRLAGLFSGLAEIARDLPLVLPMHPRTKNKLAQVGVEVKAGSGLIILEPVGYFDMLELLRNCRLVLTDSGGLQKEAYFFRKPCVTMRDETEWVELVDNGVNVLVGADAGLIAEKGREMASSSPDFGQKLYGDGQAGRAIVEFLADRFAAV